MEKNNAVKTKEKPGEKKKFKWEELPFVGKGGARLWSPDKVVSAKGRLARELIGEEFALAYLKLIQEEWPGVGLTSLFFIAKDMAKGGHLEDNGGIERAFFDAIDRILRDYCIKQLPIGEWRAWNRGRTVNMLAHTNFPKTWKLETLEVMRKLDETIWEKKSGVPHDTP